MTKPRLKSGQKTVRIDLLIPEEDKKRLIAEAAKLTKDTGRLHTLSSLIRDRALVKYR